MDKFKTIHYHTGILAIDRQHNKKLDSTAKSFYHTIDVDNKLYELKPNVYLYQKPVKAYLIDDKGKTTLSTVNEYYARVTEDYNFNTGN